MTDFLIYNRKFEVNAISHLLENRKSCLIFVHGEAGSGKSTVIDCAISRSGRFEDCLNVYNEDSTSGLIDAVSRAVDGCSKSSWLGKLVEMLDVEVTLVPIPNYLSINLKKSISKENSLPDQQPANQLPISAAVLPNIVRQRIGKLFQRAERIGVKVLTVRNTEYFDSSQIWELAALLKCVTTNITLIVEFGGTEQQAKSFVYELKKECDRKNLDCYPIYVDEFSYNAAKSFYKYMKLDTKGVEFQFKKNGGNAVSILYDIYNSIEISDRITDSAIPRDTIPALCLLCLFFNSTGGKNVILRAANALNIELDLNRLHRLRLARVSESSIRIWHPKLFRHLLNFEGQSVSRILSNYVNAFPNETDTRLIKINFFEFIDDAVSEEDIKFAFRAFCDRLWNNRPSTARVIVEAVESLGEQIPNRAISLVKLMRNQMSALQHDHFGRAQLGEMQHPIDVLNTLISLSDAFKQRSYNDVITVARAALAVPYHWSQHFPADLASRFRIYFEIYQVNALICLGALDEALSQMETVYAQMPNDRVGEALVKSMDAFTLGPKSIEAMTIPDWVNELPTFLRIRLIHNSLSAQIYNNPLRDGLLHEFENRVLLPLMAGNSVDITFSLNNIGVLEYAKGNLEKAYELFLEMSDRSTQDYDEFTSKLHLMVCAFSMGKSRQSEAYKSSIVDLIGQRGFVDPVFKQKFYFNCAVIARFSGDMAAYQMHYDEAVQQSHGRANLVSDLLSLKIRQLDEYASSHHKHRRPIFQSMSAIGGDLTACTVFWMQTLFFWDVNVPILDETLIDRIALEDLFNE